MSAHCGEPTSLAAIESCIRALLSRVFVQEPVDDAVALCKCIASMTGNALCAII